MAWNYQRHGGGAGARSYRQRYIASGNAVEAARKRAVVNSNINLTPPAEKCPEPAGKKEAGD